MGIFYVAVPFMLITWAEQSIDSALATILQALTPLFALVIAALVLQEEPITVNKLGGLVLGFGGAVVILARHLTPVTGADPTAGLTGELALVLSCVSYAGAAVFQRRAIGTRPLIDDPFGRPASAAAAGDRAAPERRRAGHRHAAGPDASKRAPACRSRPTPPPGSASSGWASSVRPSPTCSTTGCSTPGAPTGPRSSPTPCPSSASCSVSWSSTRSIDLQTLVGTAMVIGGIALANAPFGRRVLYRRGAPATVLPAPTTDPIARPVPAID